MEMCQPLIQWELFFSITEMVYTFTNEGRTIIASDGVSLFFYEQFTDLIFCFNEGKST